MLNRITVSLIAVLSLSLPVNASNATTVIVGEDMNGQHVTVVKRSFAQKHPRLHKVGRRMRKLCVTLSPIVSVAGSAAQVVSMLRR